MEAHAFDGRRGHIWPVGLHEKPLCFSVICRTYLPNTVTFAAWPLSFHTLAHLPWSRFFIFRANRCLFIHRYYLLRICFEHPFGL